MSGPVAIMTTSLSVTSSRWRTVFSTIRMFGFRMMASVTDCENLSRSTARAPPAGTEETKSHCPKCHSPIRVRKIRRGNQLFFCDKTNDPDCDFTSFDLPIDGKECETCGSYMVQKRFRGRNYIRCGNKECPTNIKKKKTTAKKTKKKAEAEG